MGKLDKLNALTKGKGVLKKGKKYVQTTSVKQHITILPELERFIFPLADEQFEQLEQNIIKDGCRDSLIVWERNSGEYILVDGHNRHRICQKHQLDFNVKIVDFKDIQAVEDWMINNQLGRRNVTPEQASYLRGLQYNREKGERGGYEQVLRGKDDDTDESKAKNWPSIKNTAERLAEEHNVSKNTIKNDGAFHKGLKQLEENNPELKKSILTGKVKVKKSDVQSLSKVKTIPKLENAEGLFNFLNKKSNKSAPVVKNKEVKVKQLDIQKQKLQTLIGSLAKGKENNQEILDSIVKEVEVLKKLI